MDRAVFLTQFIDLYSDKTSRENYLTFLRSPKYCQKVSFRNQCWYFPSTGSDQVRVLETFASQVKLFKELTISSRDAKKFLCDFSYISSSNTRAVNIVAWLITELHIEWAFHASFALDVLADDFSVTILRELEHMVFAVVPNGDWFKFFVLTIWFLLSLFLEFCFDFSLSPFSHDIARRSKDANMAPLFTFQTLIMARMWDRFDTARYGEIWSTAHPSSFSPSAAWVLIERDFTILYFIVNLEKILVLIWSDTIFLLLFIACSTDLEFLYCVASRSPLPRPRLPRMYIQDVYAQDFQPDS